MVIKQKFSFLLTRKGLSSMIGLAAVGIGVVIFALGQSGSLDALSSEPERPTSVQQIVGDNVMFLPAIAPSRGAEIANPMRGAQYYGGEASPPNWPVTDRYARLCWRDLEPTEGQYDFSRIDHQLAIAGATGYTFGWRIMPVNPTGVNPCLPDYLIASMPKGFYTDRTYIPDYNDPNYLIRAQALITALGERYDNDSRVGMLDMSLYGCWGEWNESCVDYPGPTGAEPMTAENRQALVDMQFQAFPHKRFLMLTSHQDTLNYALNYPRLLRTGVRIDCLGQPSLGGARKNLDNNPIEHNQWRIAPLYFEYCSHPDFALALVDIKKYHASVIGDGEGNLSAFESYQDDEQRNLIQSFKISGYRFVLDSLMLPLKLTRGANFLVTSHWININTAPAYLPWNVMIQLRTDDSSVVWQGKSQLDLRQPFSSVFLGKDSHTTIDHFNLPDHLAAGKYNVCVQILDPTNIYAPLALANKDRQRDGSYCLGRVSVF